MRGTATSVHVGLNPTSHSILRGPMYQGGDVALQVTCGRFDSDGLHQFRFISIVWPNALGCQPRDHRFESGMNRHFFLGIAQSGERVGFGTRRS